MIEYLIFVNVIPIFTIEFILCSVTSIERRDMHVKGFF